MKKLKEICLEVFGASESSFARGKPPAAVAARRAFVLIAMKGASHGTISEFMGISRAVSHSLHHAAQNRLESDFAFSADVRKCQKQYDQARGEVETLARSEAKKQNLEIIEIIIR